MRYLPRVVLLLAVLAGHILPAAEPFISEFMASNQNSIRDEDGDRSDWIEIRNPGPASVNLAGWYLTDNATNKTKWAFPTLTLPPGEHLLVFASNKNRRNPAAPLHTNFALSADGEYLGLIRPDGSSAASEFSPSFPPQYPDISYGLAVNTTSVTLVDKPTPIRAFVPADNLLGTTWRQTGFNDSTWIAGTYGIGYFNTGANPNLSADLGINLGAQMSGTTRNSYSRARFQVTDPSKVVSMVLRMNYDDGFHAWINGQWAARSPNAPAEGALAFNSTATNHNPGTFESFDLSSRIGSLIAGQNVLAIQGLNVNATSSDAFIWPQLIITQEAAGGGQTGYFAVATPGAANGGVDSLQLPQTIAFSRSPGLFTTGFSLSLSGAAQGQVIRYVIADPSGTGGTGAAIPEPTAGSTPYSGPIAIGSSKVIRAAVFTSDGTQKGITATANYAWLETGVTNNTSNFTSNLPIIVLSNHGFGQPVDSSTNTYTTAMMHIFEPVNGTASLAQQIPHLFSRTGFRVRGSSSQGFPKKSYGMETWNEKDVDLDRPLLGLASESDWILNGPYQFDDTYIHNAYIYEVSRRIGRWAPRTRVVEMFVDQNGGKLDYQDYNGIYVLTEKIKSKSNRLDIKGILPGDNTGENLTGGYIFKIDRVDPGEVSWITQNGVPISDRLVLSEPDPDFDTPEQIAYIQGYVQQFDSALVSDASLNFNTRTYRDYIDVPSFIDHHILNALAYNVDALRLSAFFFKDRARKIHAGPLWDLDRALGSDDGRDANPQSWNNITYIFTRDWWGRLFQDREFVQAWVDRWWELRGPGGAFQTASLTALATEMGNEIGNAAGARDAAKWPQNAPDPGQNYLNEISKMNNWLSQRLAWLDSQLPRPVNSSLASGVVAPGTAVTLSGSGTSVFRYTIDGSDPRAIGGGLSPGTIAYTGPIVINQTTVITVRPIITTTPFPGATSINWGPPRTYVYLVDEAFAVSGDVAIREVNYNPLGPTPAEAAAVPGVRSDDFEFIEISNIGGRKVNLFEMSFAEGAPFTRALKLKPMTLNPGDLALVVRNRAAATARYGSALDSRIAGEWIEGELSDGGEIIRFNARDGSPIHTFAYDDDPPWPLRADGAGSSLEFTGGIFADVVYANGTNWRASSEIHGSPGSAGAGPDTRMVINEVLSQSTLPRVDAIELKNRTPSGIDISGWYLSRATIPESELDYMQFPIPQGTIVPGLGYSAFTEASFNPNGPWNPGAGTPGAGEFALDGLYGDRTLLIEADASGRPRRFVDSVEFRASRQDESWGRWPDGEGSLYPMAQRTLFDEGSALSPRPGMGSQNSGPRVGPIVITEIHHAPGSGNSDLEFVELHNPMEDAQSLHRWRLRGAVDYNFTAETLPPGGFLVVVPFPPTDSTRASAFRTAFGISASVPLAGPWSSGNRLGSSERVVVYRAETPPPTDPAYFPMSTEDETNYSTGGAWPVATGGLSLNRKGVVSPGDAPSSWKADAPSPGSPGPSYAQWAAVWLPGGANPDADPDGDGASNGLEYGLGTVPTSSKDELAFRPILQPQPVSAGNHYTFTYHRPLDRQATYSVQTSSDFLTWTTVPDFPISLELGVQLRRAEIEVPHGTEQIFVRLRIAIP